MNGDTDSHAALATSRLPGYRDFCNVRSKGVWLLGNKHTLCVDHENISHEETLRLVIKRHLVLFSYCCV